MLAHGDQATVEALARRRLAQLGPGAEVKAGLRCGQAGLSPARDVRGALDSSTLRG
jgi:hypothetical protein